MRPLLSTIVPLLLLAQPHPAPAQSPSIRPVPVSTTGLDLATPDGAAAMLTRIDDAAEKGCAQDRRWDRYSADYRRCRAAVTADAVAKLGAPVVTALHAAGSRSARAEMIAALGR